MNDFYKVKFHAILLGLILFAESALAKELLLYGGSNHDEFLGCLVCNEYSSESVCNGYGQYGNEYGSNMWNEYSSPYGNEYSPSSPWNEYSVMKSIETENDIITDWLINNGCPYELYSIMGKSNIL